MIEYYPMLLARGYELRDDCILSTATPTSHGYRYVQPTVNGQRPMLQAHRLAYEVWHGPIPQGYHIDHACHNEATHRGECAGQKCFHLRCMNPMHLRAVPPGDNYRASKLFTDYADRRKARTACINGHDYIDDNFKMRIRNGTESRECKVCNRLAARQQRAKIRRCDV